MNMGGYGSVRYADRDRKITVESCLPLSLAALADKGLAIRAGINVQGTVHARDNETSFHEE
jgi:hypothetical protein